MAETAILTISAQTSQDIDTFENKINSLCTALGKASQTFETEMKKMVDTTSQSLTSIKDTVDKTTYKIHVDDSEVKAAIQNIQSALKTGGTIGLGTGSYTGYSGGGNSRDTSVDKYVDDSKKHYADQLNEAAAQEKKRQEAHQKAEQELRKEIENLTIEERKNIVKVTQNGAMRDTINKIVKEEEKALTDLANQAKKWQQANDRDQKAYDDALKAKAKQAEKEAKEEQRIVAKYQKQYEAARKAEIEALKRRSQMGLSDKKYNNSWNDPELLAKQWLDNSSQYLKNASLAELKSARNAIKQSMGTLDVNSKEWQRFNKVLLQVNQKITNTKQQMGELKSTTESLGVSTNRLGQLLGMVFSVATVSNFLRSLIQVRGEFELQHRALQAIIQDNEAANQIWEKTVALAIKSPFRVKELVTYTKQLAAFRFETDELYDTTKMLADVSSGLGVDMQRLILAMGQVKAANYLRGQESRQFSNAGVNILGELAKSFSEVENRAVSVGEVFEMVSKRKVLYEDVANVFKRITSEGGTFYRMQEIQAETLQGQLSNLKDRIDILYNQIGQRNDGFIKGVVQGIIKLLNNWQSASTILLTLTAAIVGAKGVFDYYRISAIKAAIATNSFTTANLSAERGVTKFVARLTLQKKALDSLAATSWLSAGAVGAIAAVLGFAFLKLRQLNKETKEAKEKYDEAIKSSTSKIAQNEREAESVGELVKEYNTLSVTMKDMVEGSDEHNNALKRKEEIEAKLNQSTTNLSNSIDSETGMIMANTLELKANNDELERKLRINIAMQAQATGRNDIGSFTSKINEFQSDKNTKVLSAKAYEDNLIGLLKATNANDEVIQAFLKEAKAGKTISDVYEYLYSLDSEYSELAIIIENILLNISKTYYDINYDNRELDRYIDKLKKSVVETFGFLLGKSTDEKQTFAESVKSEILNNWNPSGDESLNKLYADIINEMLGIELDFSKVQGTVNMSPWMERYQREMTDFFNNLTEEQNKTFGNAIKGFMYGGKSETLGDMIGRLDPTAPIDQREDLVNRIKEWKDDAEEQLKILATEGQVIYSQEEIESKRNEYGTRLTFADYFLSLLGITDKENAKNAKTRLNEYMKNVVEMYNSYMNNLKEMSPKQALDKVKYAFKDSFDDDFWDKLIRTSDNKKVTAFDLEWLTKTAAFAFDRSSPELEKLWQEFFDKFWAQADVEKEKSLRDGQKKLFDGLFSNFKNTQELRKLGIDDSIGQKIGEVLFGDSFKVTSLEGIKAALDNIKKQKMLGGNWGEEDQKLFEELTKQYDDLVAEEQRKLMEKYINYTKQAMSATLAAKVEFQRAITEIENMSIDDDLKEKMKAGAEEAFNKAYSKARWEDFKNDNVYISMWEDIDRLSSASIDNMLDRLYEMKDTLHDLDPASLKEIDDRIDKLNKQKESRNTPLGEIKNASKYLKENDISGLIERRNNRFNTYKTYLAQLYEAQSALAKDVNNEELQKRVVELERLVSLSEESFDNASSAVDTYYASLERLKNGLAGVIDNLESTASLISEVFVNDYTQGILNNVQALKQLLSAMGSVKKNMEDYRDLSDDNKGFFSFLSSAAMGDYIAMAVAILKVIKSITNTIESVQIDKIETLADRFKDLQDAMNKNTYGYTSANYEDTAFGLDYRKAVDNINEQIDRYESLLNMVSVFNRKKRDEYQDNIDDLYDRLEDLKQQAIETWGGVGGDNYRSEAASFVSAWKAAFLETGSGLEGLKDQFDELIMNTFEKQATMRIAQAYLNPIFSMLDNYVSEGSDGGFNLTPEEIDKIRAEFEKVAPALSTALEDLFNALGMGSNIGGGLSGLTKGIQGITEDTAEVLAAYLNSIRFFISDSNSMLGQINLKIGNAQDDSVLSNLRTIANQTSAIRQLLNNTYAASSQRLKVSAVIEN